MHVHILHRSGIILLQNEKKNFLTGTINLLQLKSSTLHATVGANTIPWGVNYNPFSAVNFKYIGCKNQGVHNHTIGCKPCSRV